MKRILIILFALSSTAIARDVIQIYGTVEKASLRLDMHSDFPVSHVSNITGRSVGIVYLPFARETFSFGVNIGYSSFNTAHIQYTFSIEVPNTGVNFPSGSNPTTEAYYSNYTYSLRLLDVLPTVQCNIPGTALSAQLSGGITFNESHYQNVIRRIADDFLLLDSDQVSIHSRNLKLKARLSYAVCPHVQVFACMSLWSAAKARVRAYGLGAAVSY